MDRLANGIQKTSAKDLRAPRWREPGSSPRSRVIQLPLRNRSRSRTRRDHLIGRRRFGKKSKIAQIGNPHDSVNHLATDLRLAHARDSARDVVLSLTADPVLVADFANLAVREVHREHVLRRPNRAERGRRSRVEDLGAVGAALVRRDITLVALDVERQPMRSPTTAQGQPIFKNPMGSRTSQT